MKFAAMELVPGFFGLGTAFVFSFDPCVVELGIFFPFHPFAPYILILDRYQVLDFVERGVSYLVKSE